MTLQANKLMIRARGTYISFRTWTDARDALVDFLERHPESDGLRWQIGKLDGPSVEPWAIWRVS